MKFAGSVLVPKCAALTKFQPISFITKKVMAKKHALALEPLKLTAPYFLLVEKHLARPGFMVVSRKTKKVRS